tara:strand:- start:2869 stop:3717 length:849 start_codon:yes stop_codon:yes gene_type:complete
MINNYSKNLKKRLLKKQILPIIGVYDQFSASIAAKEFEGVFCSGYGFSASYYGLPDQGFISWSDMISFVQKMRNLIKNNHIIVDIDDGYNDDKIAANVCKNLELIGTSAVILEDQKRPKKCGHLSGKEIIPLDDYIKRLQLIKSSTNDLFIIARTDSNNFKEGLERIVHYKNAGADALMIEGIENLSDIERARERIGNNSFLVVNMISGGKTKNISFSKLKELGVDLVIYSTPCLFLAHKAIKNGLKDLKRNDGLFSNSNKGVSFEENLEMLENNLKGIIDE